ncbi:MAG TPA: hypothetical protein VF152_07240 [Acidimicrobiia bacterium]
MSPASHRRLGRGRTGTYRPPRDRREIAVAVLAALGVVVVTAVLLFALRPRDDTSDAPPVPAPLPTESTAPADTLTPPDTSVPPETLAPDATSAPAP